MIHRPSQSLEAREARLAWLLVMPALALLAVMAAGPVVATIWESLFQHDLRLPWLGRPFVGPSNYFEAAADPRFRQALAHTVVFTVVSVTIELMLGLMIALALDGLVRLRGLTRVLILLPWALPSVVAALIWRLMFEGQSGPLRVLLGVVPGPVQVEWLAGSRTAWVPIVLGDVWKTTPFVALLLFAGLQGIDRSVEEAARLDGASAWRRLVHITVPLLKPAIVVSLVLRTLDAFRVFDLVFVLTGGGPGTATEVVSLYTFTSLLQNLRFGYGAALAVIVFLVGFALAMACVRALGASPWRPR
jgi:ABC-type sugar transport system permease subunit